MSTKVALEELFRALDMSRAAYDAYRANGRTFRCAVVIFARNSTVRELALGCMSLVPHEVRPDLERLVHHLDAWADQWKELEQGARPEPDDEFIFESRVKFPRDSVGKLERLYRTL